VSETPRIRSIVGIALNAAIDRIVAVDRLEPGAIHRPTILSSLAGGKAANAVRAAASLGLPGRVVAVLGGHAGAWYGAALRALGIELSAVAVDGETRTCLSVLDRSTDELTEFYEPGLTVPTDTWPRIEAALVEALGDEPAGSLVVLAGSLPPGVPVDAYRRLGTICTVHGAPWIVDIEGRPLLEALEASPWLVKVNEREAAATTGLPGQVGGDAEAVRKQSTWFRKQRAGNVLITRGREGAMLHTAEGRWAIGPPPVTGPFSVGSGDALVAGLAVALAAGRALPEAVRYGSAVAAANALVAGQGVFDPGRVDVIEAAISITKSPDSAAGGSFPSG
jgi:tagatose 6-phosphate kinase